MAEKVERSKSAAAAENVKDVIIIGAGISGLSSAKLLTEKYGLDVVVLEARDRVGGRTYTVQDPSYNYTDLGGAYVGPTQRRVYRLASELGLEFYMVNQKEKTIMNIGGTFMKYYGTIPPITDPIKAMDLNYAQRKLDRLAKEIPVEAPWKAKKAKEWDSMTYQQFIDQTCWTKFTRETMALISKAVLCVEAHEVSLLYILWYVASGQGIQRLVTITNGAQERKFIGGSMQLSTKMADRLGDKLKLSQPVIRLEQGDSDVSVQTANGQIFKAKYVISAMPVALLNRVTFDPPLPPLKIQMIQRMPMGSIIKTMTFYKKAFWKEKGLCGEMATDHGPILYCMDDTKPDGSHPCLMGFILASTCREMTEMTEEERKVAIAQHYAKVFRCKDMLEPVNYVEKNWMEEEYSGGCYVSAPAPGVLTSFGPILRQPYKRVYFAGTESATYWAGYMEGAIEAGERAAREVLHSMKRISFDQIWQEEPPVPEFPEPPFKELAIERMLPSVTGFLWFCGVVATGASAWMLQRYTQIDIVAFIKDRFEQWNC